MQQKLGAAAAADGSATLTFTPRGSQVARVRQVSVEAAEAAGGASGALRLNGVLIAPFVPHGDAVAGEPPIDVQPGEALTAEWTNAGAGVIVSALVIWEWA